MAAQILDLTEFAEKLYRAGSPFAKDIFELIDRNAELETFQGEVAGVLIDYGALDEDDYNTDEIELLRALLPKVE